MKLVVNNLKLYNYHIFTASVRDAAQGFAASISAQFYNEQNRLYCSKVICKQTYKFKETAQFITAHELERIVGNETRGTLLPEVIAEQRRQINTARRA